MKTSLLSVERSLPGIQNFGFPFTLSLKLNNEDFKIIVKYMEEIELKSPIRKMISYEEENIYFYGKKETLKKIKRQVEDFLLFKST